MVPGYDGAQAERTSRIVIALAKQLELDPGRFTDLEVTCLLHDLGPAGMDPSLFGLIFRLAEEHGVPVRPPEMQLRYPTVDEGDACKHFLDLMMPVFHDRGIEVTPAVVDHVSMRFDFRGRLRRVLAEHEPKLSGWGISVKPWMVKIMLYYYYPALMKDDPAEVRHMGMMLVAGENFEAYNNKARARDYYLGREASLASVFSTLDRFEQAGVVKPEVMLALKRLTAAGRLDQLIKESRGMQPDDPLPSEVLVFQQTLGRR